MNAARRQASTTLATRYGHFMMHVYRDEDAREHVALTVGDVADGRPVVVRLHSECLTGDVFGSYRCDCGEQLDDSLRELQRRGRGVLLYLRQEGRGIGLVNKIRAYALQDHGYDTVEANLALGLPEDGRDYDFAALMLLDLGVGPVELMTNNPAKISGLEQNGITVIDRLPIAIPARPQNIRYLQTKQRKMGHLLFGQPPTPVDLPISADGG